MQSNPHPGMAPLIATLTLNPALDLSASADRLIPTDKIRCGTPRFDPGGGGINVARVACRLGADAVAVFPAGGAIGDQLQQLIEAEAVPTSIVRIAGRTRESFVIDETETGLQYRFVFPGPSLSTEEQARILDCLRSLPRRPSCMVVSGSLPKGIPPDFFATLRDLSSSLGTRLLLDMPGDQLSDSAGPGVYLMKPNRKELQVAIGRELTNEQDELDAAMDLIERGWAEIVVVSLGDRGALLVTAGEAERLPSIPIEVCSAVGAGDSMVAGIAVGLVHGLSIRDAVRLGAAAGTAALTTPGTELARREDIERLYGRASPAAAAD